MKKRVLHIDDFVGLFAVLVVASLGVWSGVFHAPRTTQRLEDLQAGMRDMRNTLRSAEAALRRQQAELTALEKDIAQRGALPRKSPVESDLRLLTTLAEGNQVELTRIFPSSDKTYPGITESKYAVEAKTTFAGLVDFLHAFENSPFWADITSLEIGQPRNQKATGEDASQKTRFVVSLFASNDPEGEASSATP